MKRDETTARPTGSAKPPSGTVTFLFTDIEGSTKLWEAHREAMQAALARHDALMRDSIESNGGYVFKTVGDAFCAAFPTAPEALAAALTAQRALHAETWDVTPIRARMAMHSGNSQERDGDYFGPPVNRVARLMCGHGGQVLLSQAVFDLVRDQLPANTSLRDLGEHRLKDLTRPENIYQVIVPNLPSDFPPLKTLDTLPNNLPIQFTSFIGREHEIVEAKRLLANTHLLTLTGAGGCGKTRLATQIAAEMLDAFKDGVWFIELAPLADPALIAQTVVSILGLQLEGDRPTMTVLTEFLRARAAFLILDNCEHMISDCAKFADTTLHAAPNVKILATSREALGVSGETAYLVPSLGVPDPKNLPPLESLTQYDAVRLFIDRAVAVSNSFTVTNANAPAVAQICNRLDGIPLALELAASRVKSLKVEEIAVRLDDRFRLLTGGSRTALPRQQTLRALIDWSYSLLSEPERALLRRLSVFVGGWTIEAAEAVCADSIPPAHLSKGGLRGDEILDLLLHLVDKSLVVLDEQSDETRYRMLETMRQYAREKLLESGEVEQVRDQHMEFFTDFAEKYEPELSGAEQMVWLNRFEIDHDNFRAALERSQQAERGTELGLRLVSILAQFWVIRGYLHEGRERISAALAHAQSLGTTAARGKALNSAARLTYRQSDYPTTRSFSEEALAIFRERNDKQGISQALGMLGNIAAEEGDYETAPRLFEEALTLRRELKDVRGTALALHNLAWASLRPGDYVRASTQLKEALALYRSVGDKFGTAMALSGLAEVALREGRLEPASLLIEESLDLRREVGDKWGIGVSLGTWAWIAMRERAWQSAFARLKESVAVRKEIGDKGGIAWCLERLAEVAMAKKEKERAARIFGAASTLRGFIGSVIDPVDQPEYEKIIAELKIQLGDDAFVNSWANGNAMTMEQAIEYAMQE